MHGEKGEDGCDLPLLEEVQGELQAHSGTYRCSFTLVERAADSRAAGLIAKEKALLELKLVEQELAAKQWQDRYEALSSSVLETKEKRLLDAIHVDDMLRLRAQVREPCCCTTRMHTGVYTAEAIIAYSSEYIQRRREAECEHAEASRLALYDSRAHR
jgi:hypothetical protein